MPFVEDVIQGVERMSTTRYRNASDMSSKIRVSQPIISRLLARKSNPRLDVVGRILDALGVRVVFPDEQRGTLRRAVVATQGHLPDGERVPGVFHTVPRVAAANLRPGGVLPGEAAGWFVINADVADMQGRDALVATVLERHHDALMPKLGPGDVAIVDTADRAVGSTPAVFAVRTPKGDAIDFRRVTAQPAPRGDTYLIYASDNPYVPPVVHTLSEYGGDLLAAIMGRVVRVAANIVGR